MENINTTFSGFISELWSKAPQYVLLGLVLFLQLRTERRMEERFNRIELILQLHDYKLEAHEKRIDKLENN